MKKHICTVILLASTLLFAACASYPPSQATVEYDKSIPAEKIQKIINDSARKLGWGITQSKIGRTELLYKGFTANVTYTDGNITISDSGGHRKTAAWTARLAGAIYGNLTSAPPPEPPSSK